MIILKTVWTPYGYMLKFVSNKNHISLIQVVLKIIQHCQEEGAEGDVVHGVLLGLVEGNKLEITNCFPFSQNSEENDDEDSKSRL